MSHEESSSSSAHAAPSSFSGSPPHPPSRRGDSLRDQLVMYVSQLLALSRKNALVLRRSVMSLCVLLLLPLVFVAIMWIIQSRINASNSGKTTGIETELTYQPCKAMDIYGNVDNSAPCVSIYYSPSNDTEVNAIMSAFAARSGLQLGIDIVAQPDVVSLIVTLANNIGRYDGAITFDQMTPQYCMQPAKLGPCTNQTQQHAYEAHPTFDRGAIDQLYEIVNKHSSERFPSSSSSPVPTPFDCPITHNTTVYYTLWLNKTGNPNDHAPSWVTTGDHSFLDTDYIVPPRYWILQHLLDLAIIDVITTDATDASEAAKAEAEARLALLPLDVAELRASEERRLAAIREKVASIPNSNSLRLELFDLLRSSTGTSHFFSSSSTFSLSDYANDSVPKWAGSSIISLGVLVCALLSMQLLAYEKQQRLIGLMRIMGMRESAYWYSWLFTFTFLSFFAALFATGLGKISGLQVYAYCDFSIHLISLWLYQMSMTTFTLVWCSFITRPLILNIISFIIFFAAVMSNVFLGGILANLLYNPQVPGYVEILVWILPWFHYSKTWSDILINTSVITIINDTKKVDTQVQFTYSWSQITESQRMYQSCAYGDEVCCNDTIGNCFNAPSTSSAMLAQVILTAFFLFASWYFATVFGGNLGRSSPPWFFLQPKFWGANTEDDKKLQAIRDMMSGNASAAESAFLTQDRLVHEQYLSLKNDELRLYKLSKSYDKTSALKECTLKMHKDEVFVLLGHNGAGKSTLVNCLTGLLEPTFGSAFIFGESISNIDRIQKNMGVAMQDDLLFDDLTTRETLSLFGAIRGIPWADLKSMTNEKLAQFHMNDYADKAVRSLSGGMKRRLSLSLATLGNPRIVFLDEPTTGMDPVNRNKIWATIKALKQNRIIVLTTHNMEEADYLGDTIALMSGGRIRAMGSSLFLKNRYGAGYQLQLQINPIQTALVQRIIKELLPGCEIIHSAGESVLNADQIVSKGEGVKINSTPQHGNLTIGLKRKSLRALPQFFAWLESEEQRVKSAQQENKNNDEDVVASNALLREWSLSNSTLEEVFLRLCAAEKNINQKLGTSGVTDDADDDQGDASLLLPEEEPDAKCMLCKHRVALDKVTLYSKSGHPVDFAQLLCGECSHSPQMTKMMGSGGDSAAESREDDIMDDSTSMVQALDDAPIELHAEKAPLLASPFLMLPPPVASLNGGVIQAATSSPLTAQKGLNTDLNIAQQEDAFHKAWDEMGHKIPSTWSQVRAVYLKNFELIRREKKSSLCKLILLAVLTLLIAWLTTPKTTLCPQGWIPAQKQFLYDSSSLPCNPGDVSLSFAYHALSYPIVSEDAPDLYYSKPPFDTDDCMQVSSNLTFYGSFCGWVPTWPISQESPTQNFWSYTTDAIDATTGARPLDQVPFMNWTVPYPQYMLNSNSLSGLGFIDQTATISSAKEAVPQIPNGSVLWQNSSQPILPYGERSKAQRRQRTPIHRKQHHKLHSFTASNWRDSISHIEYVSNPAIPPQPSIISSPSSTDDGSSIPVAGSTLNDILIANQLWIDSHATKVPDLCKDAYYGQSPSSALVLFFASENSTWSNQNALFQEARQYFYSLLPSIGLTFVNNRPYPVDSKTGIPINETAGMNFSPSLEYKLTYWNQDSLPQVFFLIAYDPYDGQPTCQSVTSYNVPYLAGSQQIPQYIHGLTNSFLVTRMAQKYGAQSQPTNPITFTPYTEFTSYPPPIKFTNTCPNPKISVQFLAFPSVNYQQALSQTNMEFALALLVFVSFLNMPNSISHLISERENQLIHQMRISGMRDSAYWLATYMWDATQYALWFIVLIICGYAYGSLIFRATNIGVWILACFSFIHYVIGISWMIASLFSKKRVVLVVAYLVSVVVAFLSTVMDMYLGQNGTNWPTVYLWIPPLGWSRVVSAIIRYTPQTILNEHGDQFGSAILIMLFEGTMIGGLAVYLNVARYRGYGYIIPQRWKWWIKNEKRSDDHEIHSDARKSLSAVLLDVDDSSSRRLDAVEDIDVQTERRKVNDIIAERDRNGGDVSKFPSLLLHNLRKTFASRVGSNSNPSGPEKNIKVAIDQLCLTVNYGECFGLLGPNGAGKSTTLSILTGLMEATSGSAYMCGYDQRDGMDAIFSILGICPQSDIVWDDLTIYAHLLFYARLKGVPSAWERGLVQYIAELIELDGDPLHKPAVDLSGGMRRRLSLGISLIGNPRIWLLDEPTTGLSPETRREIWSIIAKRKSRSAAKPGSIGKSIVITTHSMEEADTLCDRIGILADGALQCVGTAPHLKSKFGEGFKLTLHLQHEFERRGVHDIVDSEVSATLAPRYPSSLSAPLSSSEHPLAKHQVALANTEFDLHSSTSSSSSTPLTSTQLARAAQHCNLLRFISRMAPYAVLSHIEGKNVQFRLQPAHAASIKSAHSSSSPPAAASPTSFSTSSSSPVGDSHVDHSRTAEVLSVFNHMERHRAVLLSHFDIEEWSITQSSLEEVFMTIVKRFERDESTD